MTSTATTPDARLDAGPRDADPLDVRPEHFQPRVGLALLAAAFTLLSAQQTLRTGELGWGISCVLAAGVTSAVAIPLNSRVRRDGWLLPLSIVALWVVGYGVSAVAWTRPDDLWPVVRAGLRPENVPPAMALAGLGLLAWTAGFLVLRLRVLQVLLDHFRTWATRGTNHPETSYRFGRVVGVYAIGVGGRLGLLLVGRFSFITVDLQSATTESSRTASVLDGLELFALIGLILIAYVAFTEGSRRGYRWLASAVVIEVAFGLLSGFRSAVIIKCIAVGIVYIVVRRRFPVVGFLVVVLTVSFLTPFSRTYRAEVRADNRTQVTATEAVGLMPDVAVSTLQELTPLSLVAAPTDLVTHRLRFVDEVAIIMQRTPSEFPYTSATETVGQAAGVFVPRVIWKDKPVYVTGLEYARRYWNQREEVINSRPATLVGDSYLRGGWTFTMIILFLMGGLTRAFNESLSSRRYIAAAPLFTPVWIQLTDLEEGLVTTFAELAQVLILTAIAMRWAIHAPAERAGEGTGDRSPPAAVAAGHS